MEQCKRCGSGTIDGVLSCGSVYYKGDDWTHESRYCLRLQLSAQKERAAVLEKALKRVGANLIAAVSLLESSPKTGAASDKMFDTMLSDYRKAIEFGREALGGE